MLKLFEKFRRENEESAARSEQERAARASEENAAEEKYRIQAQLGIFDTFCKTTLATESSRKQTPPARRIMSERCHSQK
jgi:hypothetical protein